MRFHFALAAVALPLAATIQLENAQAGPTLFNEIRLGIYEHDTGVIGHQKESGVDILLEGVSSEVFDLGPLAPRFVFGGTLNTEGQTNQLYAGFMQQHDIVNSMFAAEDALFVEGMLGVDWHDGKIDVSGTPLSADWKSHGSRFLIRSGVDIGYRINPTWTVALSFDHISNGDLADKNEGMNDLGLRVGMHF